VPYNVSLKDFIIQAAKIISDFDYLRILKQGISDKNKIIDSIFAPNLDLQCWFLYLRA